MIVREHPLEDLPGDVIVALNDGQTLKALAPIDAGARVQSVATGHFRRRRLSRRGRHLLSHRRGGAAAQRRRGPPEGRAAFRQRPRHGTHRGSRLRRRRAGRHRRREPPRGHRRALRQPARGGAAAADASAPGHGLPRTHLDGVRAEGPDRSVRVRGRVPPPRRDPRSVRPRVPGRHRELAVRAGLRQGAGAVPGHVGPFAPTLSGRPAHPAARAGGPAPGPGGRRVRPAERQRVPRLRGGLEHRARDGLRRRARPGADEDRERRQRRHRGRGRAPAEGRHAAALCLQGAQRHDRHAAGGAPLRAQGRPVRPRAAPDRSPRAGGHAGPVRRDGL